MDIREIGIWDAAQMMQAICILANDIANPLPDARICLGADV